MDEWNMIVKRAVHRNVSGYSIDRLLALKETVIVPYTDNPQFIGRSEILEQLKRQLGHQKPRNNNHSHFRIALYGLGGIG